MSGGDDADMVEIVEDQMECSAKEGSRFTLRSCGLGALERAQRTVLPAQPLQSILTELYKVRRIGGLKPGTQDTQVISLISLPARVGSAHCKCSTRPSVPL